MFFSKHSTGEHGTFYKTPTGWKLPYILQLNVHLFQIVTIYLRSSKISHIKTLARGVYIITIFEVPIFLRSAAELIAFCWYHVLLIVQNPKHQMVEDTAMHIAIAHCTSSQKAQQLYFPWFSLSSHGKSSSIIWIDAATQDLSIAAIPVHAN